MRGPGAWGRGGGAVGGLTELIWAGVDVGGCATGGAAVAGGVTTGPETGELLVVGGAAALGGAGGAIVRGGAALTGATGTGCGGFATGGAGALTSGAGGGVAGRAGAAGCAAPCCLPIIAFSTSPGFEICDRSIFVLISSGSTRPVRAALFALWFSLEARKCARTFSASCSSIELECVFFSVTPTAVSASRIALLLTSSSLARSLIRILLIRLFVPPDYPAKSSYQPHGSIVNAPLQALFFLLCRSCIFRRRIGCRLGFIRFWLGFRLG
jgi:hypothetical protein